MKVLARVEGDPTRAVRPWDRDRSGFLVGEGGAVLVLERLDHARARGVVPYAELAGGAIGSDAYHETALDPDPAGLARVIRRALADAGVDPAELDAVNVHGTATRSNDPLECRALRLALGPDGRPAGLLGEQGPDRPPPGRRRLGRAGDRRPLGPRRLRPADPQPRPPRPRLRPRRHPPRRPVAADPGPAQALARLRRPPRGGGPPANARRSGWPCRIGHPACGRLIRR